MLRRSALVALRRRTADGGAGTALLSAARGHAAAAAKVEGAATAAIEEARVPEGVASGNFSAASPKDVLEVLVNPNGQWGLNSRTNWMSKGLSKNEGILDQFMSHSRRYRRVAGLQDLSQLSKVYINRHMVLTSMRAFSSAPSSGSEGTRHEETRKDLTTSEDPFDAPTYNIPEKPVTFAEGASYSVVILLGLGVAAAAAYAVFKELIFEPKEYKIFGKALDRVQNDSQVRVRIGSPVTGYGQESRNRAARQRIPHKTWTDEDGVEHVEVNFFVRGPHGAGKVYSEMFKDKDDKQWKFTYLIVDITSPSQSRLMLESYIPA